jgi:hypothetical protein
MRKYELHGAGKLLHWLLVALLTAAALISIASYLYKVPLAILAVIVWGSLLVGVVYRRPNAYAILALLSLYAVSNDIGHGEIAFAMINGALAVVALLVRSQLSDVV